MVNYNIPACNIPSSRYKQENCEEKYSVETLVNCVIHIFIRDYDNFIFDVYTRGDLNGRKRLLLSYFY